LVRSDGVVFFDGASIIDVGRPVAKVLNNASLFHGTYDFTFEKLHIVVGKVILTYSEGSKTWSRRSADFNSSTFPVTSIHANQSLYVGVAGLKVYSASNILLTGVPVFDASNGTAFATPKITFQLFSDGALDRVKETTGVYVGAFTTTVGSGLNFSTGSNARIAIKYYNAADGNLTGNPTDSTLFWDSSKSDGLISLPRVPFRSISFELQLLGSVSGKPPYHITITGFEILTNIPSNHVQK
jgi:hypothetical protein